MSKKIKQLEMDALGVTFKDVRHLVVLSMTGISSQADNQMRLALRKKNIRVQVVKNSLAQRAFGGMGLELSKCWEGPTAVAWGANSVAELSRALDSFMKKNDKIKVKTAVAEGLQIPFAQALTMPTREEAIAQLIAMILSPGAQIAGALIGPAGQIASQIQTISEKTETPAEAPAG
jgi:large subunit ribosomal protein L10